jgi:sterol desaturase/sphingolipid hydroxylase (fatty acid hydroxylase superfamily)
MQGRIVFSIFIVLVGFFLPWWAVFPLFFLGSILYAPWFELIVIGLFYDLVYSVPRVSFHNFEFVYTATALVAIGLMYVIKKRFINV